ncbi:phage holin [Slackia exigua]|uniref:phage holin n=1 Tax=Slackia exigua TaxID=84109 RepID=UPI0028D39315|nr:phage holin [Slackia exigua]
MSKINWKVRIKSPSFWVGVAGAIAAPVMAYMGVTAADFTTWQSIADAFMAFVQNPYLIGVTIAAVMSFLGTLADPTTQGLGDSERALGYEKPAKDK